MLTPSSRIDLGEGSEPLKNLDPGTGSRIMDPDLKIKNLAD